MIKVKFDSNLLTNLNDFLIDGSGKERLCYVFGYKTECSNGNTIVIPKEVIVPTMDKINATETFVRINKKTVAEIYLTFFKSDYDVIINCHSHPFDKTNNVRFSYIDDENDLLEMDILFNKLSSFNNKKNDFLFLSYLRGYNSIAIRQALPKSRFNNSISISCIGENFQFINNSITNSPTQLISLSEQFNRQFNILSEKTHNILAFSKIVVVGAGGTGSITLENLSRLGAKNITIIDDDKIELTNLNRLQGTRLSDVGKFKAEVIRDNLLTYSDNMEIYCCLKNVISNEGYEIIKDADFIFSCVDNQETRYFLNRISIQFMIPLFDVGVSLIRDTNNIKSKWQVGTYIPNYTWCMNCSPVKVYDKDTIERKIFDKQTFENMRKQGYVKDEDNITAPAVYYLNQYAVSVLMREFIKYIGHEEYPLSFISYGVIEDNIFTRLVLKKGTQTYHSWDNDRRECYWKL